MPRSRVCHSWRFTLVLESSTASLNIPVGLLEGLLPSFKAFKVLKSWDGQTWLKIDWDISPGWWFWNLYYLFLLPGCFMALWEITIEEKDRKEKEKKKTLVAVNAIIKWKLVCLNCSWNKKLNYAKKCYRFGHVFILLINLCIIHFLVGYDKIA